MTVKARYGADSPKERAPVKIEYDAQLDLLYIWFSLPGQKAAQTATVAPGVHADFDAKGKLVGIEVLDASEVLGRTVQFEVGLPAVPAAQAEAAR